MSSARSVIAALITIHLSDLPNLIIHNAISSWVFGADLLSRNRAVHFVRSQQEVNASSTQNGQQRSSLPDSGPHARRQVEVRSVRTYPSPCIPFM
jgi:hypothetical protein